MDKVILFGAGKIARVLHSYMKADDRYLVQAFTVDGDYLTEDSIDGLPVIPFSEIETRFPPKDYKILVAIGYHEMNRLREAKCLQVKEKGYQLASYIAADVRTFDNVVVGENSIVLDQVSLQPFATIGDNVCIWSCVTIAHHSTIGNSCWIASGTIVGGGATVQSNCFLGINSTVGHEVTIAANNFLGGNCYISHNTEENGVYVRKDTPKFRLDTGKFLQFVNI